MPDFDLDIPDDGSDSFEGSDSFDDSELQEDESFLETSEQLQEFDEEKLTHDSTQNPPVVSNVNQVEPQQKNRPVRTVDDVTWFKDETGWQHGRFTVRRSPLVKSKWQLMENGKIISQGPSMKSQMIKAKPIITKTPEPTPDPPSQVSATAPVSRTVETPGIKEEEFDTSFDVAALQDEPEIDDDFVIDPDDENERIAIQSVERQEDRRIQQERSSTTNPPPPPPPEVPGAPDFEPEDERPIPGKSVNPAEIERAVRREQTAEFANLKRQQKRRISEEKRNQRFADRQRKQQIKLERQDQQRQLDDLEGSTTSDRIIRRLGSFGIARAVGGSGQLFAALTEMLVFRAEDDAADAQRTEQARQIRDDEANRINELESEIFQRETADIAEQDRVEDIFNAAKVKMDNAATPEDRERIIRETEQAISGGRPVSRSTQQQVPGSHEEPVTATIAAPPVVAPPIEPGPVPPPPSRDDGDEEEPELHDRRGAGEPPGGEPPITTGGSGDGLPPHMTSSLMEFGEGLQTTTRVILATNVALEGMNIVSETLTESIKSVSGALQADPMGSTQPIVGMAGQQTRTGAGIVGTSVGAGIGRTQVARAGMARVVGAGAGRLGGAAAGRAAGAGAGAVLGSAVPGVGTALGFFVGGAIGKSITNNVTEPVVTAVETGNAIMESFAERSIGLETIGASVEQDLLTFVRKIEADDSVDEITSQYVKARGELQRSLIGLQEFFVDWFGDEITVIVKGMAMLIDAIPDLLNFAHEMAQLVVPGYAHFIQFKDWLMSFLPFLAEQNQEIVDALEAVEDSDDSIKDMIADFFVDQKQFFDSSGIHQFENTLNFFNR